MTEKIVLVPGDGIGKEIAESVKEVSSVLTPAITWVPHEAGAEYYEQHGALFDPSLLEDIEHTGVCIKGPTATPVGTGFRSINVQLRQAFHTNINLRPVHSLPGVNSRYEDVDIVIFRENSEDLYKGVEYMYDRDTAHGIKIISKEASANIITASFEYARKHHRQKVTCVHKANIMKLTDGLFLHTFEDIAKQYPDIESNAVIIDAFCMKVVTDPTQFDVIVTENLYGDILSDLCAGLVGGLGFAPSANIGKDVRIYEAVHGSAPDIAGKDIANPTAILMAYSMCLKDLGYVKEAVQLDTTLNDIFMEGKVLTQDLKGTATTTQFTQEILRRLG